jgi:hypothetical protein
MTSQEPEGEPADDVSPRRRSATEDGPGERKLAAPIDPYADPYDGAGPYTVPAKADPERAEPEGAEREGAEGPYGPFDGTIIVNEPYRSGRPLRGEQERLDQYRKEQDDESLPKPPPGVVGYYPHEQKVPSHPTDSVRQFSSFGGGPPRRRRSDWPVLVFALVVTAAVTAGCCLAGFALFTTWRPFGS